MTLTSEAIVPAKPLAALLRAVGMAWAARTERRAQRLALSDLLHMDPARLDDLGINADDILAAMAAPPPAGKVLAKRRAARSVTLAARID